MAAEVSTLAAILAIPRQLGAVGRNTLLVADDAHPIQSVSNAILSLLGTRSAVGRGLLARRVRARLFDEVDHPILLVSRTVLVLHLPGRGRTEERMLVASGVRAPLLAILPPFLDAHQLTVRVRPAEFVVRLLRAEFFARVLRAEFWFFSGAQKRCTPAFVVALSLEQFNHNL